MKTVKSWSVVRARLLRVGVDTLEEIDYNAHVFTRYAHVVNGPPTDPVRLDRNALNDLAAELADEIANPPSGVDVAGLDSFLDLIRKSLPKNA